MTLSSLNITTNAVQMVLFVLQNQKYKKKTTIYFMDALNQTPIILIDKPVYKLTRSEEYSIHIDYGRSGIYFQRPMYIHPSVWTIIHFRHNYPCHISLRKTAELYETYRPYIVSYY